MSKGQTDIVEVNWNLGYMEGRGRNQAAKVDLEHMAGQSPEGLGSGEQPAGLRAMRGSTPEPERWGSEKPIRRLLQESKEQAI